MKLELNAAPPLGVKDDVRLPDMMLTPGLPELEGAVKLPDNMLQPGVPKLVGAEI